MPLSAFGGSLAKANNWTFLHFSSYSAGSETSCGLLFLIEERWKGFVVNIYLIYFRSRFANVSGKKRSAGENNQYTMDQYNYRAESNMGL